MNAKELCQLCKLSYLPPKVFKSELDEQFPELECMANFHPSSGLDAYLLGEKPTVAPFVASPHVLVVRGSDELTDWLKTNIDIRWKNHDKYRIHRGFYRQAMELAALLSESYDLRKTGIRYATGHSLGGAVIEVLMALRPFWIGEATTFGAPGTRRIASMEFVQSQFMDRCVLKDDPVPRVPLSYLSDGDTMFLNGGDDDLVNRWSWTWIGPLAKFFLSPGKAMSHHSIDAYLSYFTD